MAEDDREVAGWLSAARAGSAEALGQVLEACRGYLLLIAQRELASDLRAKGGASDLVQETFLDAQRAFKRFDGDSEADLLAWLRRLLLNNLANFARLYRDTGKRSIDREVTLPEGDSSERSNGLAALVPSPSSEAMGHEQADAVLRALEQLPEDYRQVILLRYREECTFEEIGRQMGRSANAIRKLWLRAIDRLQQEMEGSA
jgi:RNA polymerase sigma-70 factor (ECF subfamily)